MRPGPNQNARTDAATSAAVLTEISGFAQEE